MTEITVIVPRNIEESERLATTLAKSNLLPDALRGKPGDILATILAGAEMGLAPMQSVRGIAIIKGKPTLSADLMGALVKRRGDICEYLQLVESTAEKATYRTKRRGDPEPTTLSFTIQDAQRASLLGDNWKKYPAQMLRARALSGICRAVYPDLCLGLYDSDSGELTDGPLPPPPPPEEKELNPAPPVTGKRTAEVKAVLAAKTAKLPDPKEPSVQERIRATILERSITREAMASRLKALGHQDLKQVTHEDLDKEQAAWNATQPKQEPSMPAELPGEEQGQIPF